MVPTSTDPTGTWRAKSGKGENRRRNEQAMLCHCVGGLYVCIREET